MGEGTNFLLRNSFSTTNLTSGSSFSPELKMKKNYLILKRSTSTSINRLGNVDSAREQMIVLESR